MVTDSSKQNKSEGGGGDSAAKTVAENESMLYPTPTVYRVILIIGMIIFTTVAMIKAYLGAVVYDAYNTQMSVLDTFQLLSNRMHDTTSNQVNQFWIWTAFIGVEIAEKDSFSGLMKLAGSPDYFVSDIMVTTRRLKEKQNAIFPDMKSWVSTIHDPFEAPFDEAIFDTTPIQIDGSGTLVEHATEGTFGDLGGFTFSIPVHGNGQETLDQIKWLQDPANGFMASNTISVVSNIIFFNKVTNAFIYMTLKVQISPSGHQHYSFEYNRPAGLPLDASIHGTLDLLDSMELGLIFLFILQEIGFYLIILMRYFKQRTKFKETKLSTQSTFDDHVQAILSIYPPAGVRSVKEEEVDGEASNLLGEVERQQLLMFYWDEQTQQQVQNEGPSLMNALKIVLNREQRIAMYLVFSLLVPINKFYSAWYQIYYTDLKLNEVDFDQIINPDTEWRTSRSDMTLLNQFMQLNLNEDLLYVYMTLFLFFVVVRMLANVSSFSKSLLFNLTLLSRIYDFLTSFVITLGFVFLAWVMCQHLLFGARLKSYSTVWYSWVSTTMIALRDFDQLDKMFETEPNISLVFFIFFVISVMLFLSSIFVSLVMTVYGEVSDEIGNKKRSNELIIALDAHWSLDVRSCCARTKKRSAETACCLKLAGCCCKKKTESKQDRSIEDLIERPAGGRQQPKNFQKKRSVGFEDGSDEDMAGSEYDDESGDSSGSGGESDDENDSNGSKNSNDDENGSDADSAADKEEEKKSNSTTPNGDIDQDLTTRKKNKKKARKEQLKRDQRKERRIEEREEKAQAKKDKEEEVGYPRAGRRPQLQIENVDAEEMQMMRMTEIDDKEKRIVPQRRTRMTVAEFDESDSDDDDEPQYSDSDISLPSDFDNLDDMLLVKSKARRKKDANSSADGHIQRTPEEKKQLMLMKWSKDFEVYDLDADLQQDLRHTSNKQDEFMIKQREQRCGKVIWKTLVQLLYMGLYLYLLFNRNDITAMRNQNQNIEEIILKTRFHGFENEDVIMFEEIDFTSFDKVIAFIQLVDKNLLTEGVIEIKNELDTTDIKSTTMFYLGNSNNYIVTQGSTYCVSIINTQHQLDGSVEETQIQFATEYAQNLKAKFDTNAFDGKGGLCFAMLLHDYDLGVVKNGEKDKIDYPTQEFKQELDDAMEPLVGGLVNTRRVEKISYSIIIGEPVQNMLTRVLFDWEIAASGHITFNVTTTSRNYKIDVFIIAMQMAFFAFFFLNLYIFCSSEHDIFQRLKKWRHHNVDNLSKVEREQREKQVPSFFRTLNIFLRPANIAYFAHIVLTVYSELLYSVGFTKMLFLTTELADVPGKPILDNLFDEDDQAQLTREARQQFQFSVVEIFNAYLTDTTVYRRTAIFNLFLICVQPLTSASQSARFRAFLLAMGKTFSASVGLYIVLFLFSISVLFYSLHSFGYIAYDFQSFGFASMTIFKMMVGRMVGVFYQVALNVSASKAMFFTLPIILMKATFLTVFLAVVSYNYEDEVLNKDFSSNINILRSIIFCNISLEKRQKNKRTKALQETDAMKELGNEGVGDESEEDDGDADDEDNGGDMALGDNNNDEAVKVVNGGLEIYNKLDIKFMIQRKIPEWAMACADDIRQEKANRKNLKKESIQLAQKLFLNSEEKSLNAKSQEKQNQTNQENSFNLMVARKDYITYIWFGIQFFYMQGQLIQKVIESLENEIKTMLVPYMQGEQREDYLKMLDKILGSPNLADKKYNMMELKNPITNRKEVVTKEHLQRDTLQEELYIQAEVKEYILELLSIVETRLQRMRKQWRTMMLQHKQKKILEAISQKENLFKYN